MFRRPSRRRALLVAVLLLVTAFVVGYLVPVPSEGHEQRDAIARQLRERLPRWEIATLSHSYEQTWVVGLRCGDDSLDFHLLRDARPSGGLAWGDYWILPGDPSSYERLQAITDEISGWLIWREEPTDRDRLPCESATTPLG